MIAERLGMSRNVKQLVFRDAFCRMHARDGKRALRQRTRLVEHDRIQPCKGFQIRRALDEDALLRRAADAGEERQRHGDNQRARAGDNKESQRSVNPVRPVAVKQARNNCQRQREEAHGGRVNPAELGDEAFRLCLRVAGGFDQRQNLRDGGFAVTDRDLDFHHAGQVDAAAEDLVALLHVARERFTGQRRGIQARIALDDHTVQRNLLAGLDEDDVARAHTLWADAAAVVAVHQIRIVRTDVHQLRDGFAALVNRLILEVFANLVQYHDRDAFRIFRDAHCADGRNRHQEVLVEHFAMADVADGAPQHVVARDQIRRDEHDNRRPVRFAQIRLADQPQRQQRDRSRNANHQLLALVRAAVFVAMFMRVLVMLVAVIVIIVVMVMMLVTAAAFAVVMMLVMLMLVFIIVLVMMPAARADRSGRLFRFIEENLRVGFDFLHLRVCRLANLLEAVSGRFQSNLLLHIIQRHAHHARQLLQRAFHLCRAVRAVNVDFPRFLHGFRRPFRYLFRITLFAGRHRPENKHVSIRSYVIILLFMPIVKRKKKIFSPKIQKSGTCFAQMPLLRNYYYYNTIFK